MEAMTQATQTPGPWRTDGTAKGGNLDINCNQGRIAMIDCDTNELLCHMEANARLIAAAPELLAALENMVAQYAHWASQIEMKQIDRDAAAMARAAIAKARGQA